MVPHTVLRLQPGGRSWSQSEEPDVGFRQARGVGSVQSVVRLRQPLRPTSLRQPPQAYAHLVPLPVYRGWRAGLGDKLKRSGEAEVHVQMWEVVSV